MSFLTARNVKLPKPWPLAPHDPVLAIQARILLNTVVTDVLSIWRRAPRRNWCDIARLVLLQLRTLDRLYPDAGMLNSELLAAVAHFFAVNVDPSITCFAADRQQS